MYKRGEESNIYTDPGQITIYNSNPMNYVHIIKDIKHKNIHTHVHNSYTYIYT